VTDEVHDREARITEYPVEEGSDITDHIQLANDRLKISGLITETPLLYLAPLREGGEQSRTVDAMVMLETLMAQRSPFTVVTGLKRYENMFFTSLSFPRSGSMGALVFSAQLQEVRTVSTATAQVPEKDTTERGQSTKKGGKSQATNTKAAQSAPVTRDVSYLKSGLEAFGYKGL